METEFKDYERKPPLPFKLSQLGPGVAWFDLDGDGHDELIIGAGRGAAPAVLRSNGHGQFSPIGANPVFALPNDTAGLVGWVEATGVRSILLALGGYEAQTDHATA